MGRYDERVLLSILSILSAVPRIPDTVLKLCRSSDRGRKQCKRVRQSFICGILDGQLRRHDRTGHGVRECYYDHWAALDRFVVDLLGDYKRINSFL